jgi:hypothetical protein
MVGLGSGFLKVILLFLNLHTDTLRRVVLEF